MGFFSSLLWGFGNDIIKRLAPQPPAQPTQTESPNNKLNEQTNRARAYQAVPDVYGSRRVWPDMIQPSVVEYINHVKYVTEWLCVSRGKGDITAVQYADTPIESIDGASYTVFSPVAGADGYPESGTTTLTDVLEVFAAPDVNGQELEYAEPYPTVSTAGPLTNSAGGASFTVAIPDGASLARVKELVGVSGAVDVRVYVQETEPETPLPPPLFDAATTVTAATVSGGTCTLTLAGSITDAHAAVVVGVELTPLAAATETAGPFTLPVECSRIRWSTVFLRGLKGSVQIKATWWKVNSVGVEIAGTRQSQTDTYAADTYDARYWTTTVTPAAGSGRYRIEFSRLTPPIGDQGTDVAKLENLYAVRHYATKALPGVTVIRLTTQATEAATGFSERKFNLRWARHVRPLSGGALSASRNAFRAMAHIWTLAGGSDDEIDLAAMQAINTAMGETSPLLRYDGSLDDAAMSLGDRLRLVADHARCEWWRDGTRWTVTRDQARAYPAVQLDCRNLAGGGQSALSYSGHLPASQDGVELEYVDPDTHAKKAYVRLRIEAGSIVEGVASNPAKLQLQGCTTQAQAMNRARLEARRLLYSRTSVQDDVLGDVDGLGPGELVRWIDPADVDGLEDGLQAGEVLSIAGNVITTSEPLNWSGATVGRVMFTGQQGQRLGPPVLCYPSGSAVQLASVPAGLYVADGVTMQCGSRYVFATQLTDAEMEAAGLYTVRDMRPQGDGVVSVTLDQYDARLHPDDDL